MAHKSRDRPCVPVQGSTPRDHERRGSPEHRTADACKDRQHQRLRCRDDGARALRAVFSSHDNWLSLSEAERDEWRGYFDRMLEWLQHLGYTPERNPWSILLEGFTTGAGGAAEGTDAG